MGLMQPACAEEVIKSHIGHTAFTAVVQSDPIKLLSECLFGPAGNRHLILTFPGYSSADLYFWNKSVVMKIETNSGIDPITLISIPSDTTVPVDS